MISSTPKMVSKGVKMIPSTSNIVFRLLYICANAPDIVSRRNK